MRVTAGWSGSEQGEVVRYTYDARATRPCSATRCSGRPRSEHASRLVRSASMAAGRVGERACQRDLPGRPTAAGQTLTAGLASGLCAAN